MYPPPHHHPKTAQQHNPTPHPPTNTPPPTHQPPPTRFVRRRPNSTRTPEFASKLAAFGPNSADPISAKFGLGRRRPQFGPKSGQRWPIPGLTWRRIPSVEIGGFGPNAVVTGPSLTDVGPSFLSSMECAPSLVTRGPASTAPSLNSTNIRRARPTASVSSVAAGVPERLSTNMA